MLSTDVVGVSPLLQQAGVERVYIGTIPFRNGLNMENKGAKLIEKECDK